MTTLSLPRASGNDFDVGSPAIPLPRAWLARRRQGGLIRTSKSCGSGCGWQSDEVGHQFSGVVEEFGVAVERTFEVAEQFLADRSEDLGPRGDSSQEDGRSEVGHVEHGRQGRGVRGEGGRQGRFTQRQAQVPGPGALAENVEQQGVDAGGRDDGFGWRPVARDG